MTWTPILWLLAFFPALIALYFLRLRRQNVVVSSTLLWKRSLEDLRVNAPFQRLRRNLLLLLQLLVLAAIIFAAWRPRISGEQTAGRQLVVLMDRSASMAAEEGGTTRLDLRREEAIELVGGMKEGDRMVVLAFDSKTVPVEPLTGDRTRLEASLRGIEPVGMATDLAQALQVAASVAETLPSPEIVVLGDGCYGDMTDLPATVKGYSIRLIGKADSLDNLALTEIDVRRSFDEEPKTTIFALVGNYATEVRRVTCSLFLDGALRDALELEIEAGKSAPVTFDCTGVEEAIARVTLTPGDAFALDDEAWVRIAPPKKNTVAVVGGDGNPWLDMVLRADSRISHLRIPASDLPALEAMSSGQALREKFPVDVLIFDRKCPEKPPLLPALYLGCSPTLPETFKTSAVEGPLVLDWDRNHPVNRFLVYSNVWAQHATVVKDAPRYRSLLETDEGSLIGVTEFPTPGGRPVPTILVGFDILESNWPIVGHYSFPIFFANAVSWLGGGFKESGRARYRSGEALSYRLEGEENAGGDELQFVHPSGKREPAFVDDRGTATLGATAELGVYKLFSGDRELASFPVSLLSARESKLVPAEEVDFGDYKVALSKLEDQGRGLWKWLALAAVAFLFLEWFVYNRRLLG